ncbi:hypothetical protein QBC44DRAFT_371498 [Cladorrhinum sp. PSN332]|nr:hypothetical protein QBC44DRAFT_371498 [Cladorrhinum sp. PSN332]
MDKGSSRNLPLFVCLERRPELEILAFSSNLGGHLSSQTFSGKRCKIFGFHGLVLTGKENWTESDYKMGVADVFANAAARLVHENGALELILRAGIGHMDDPAQGTQGLPSWVPDWALFPETASLTEYQKSATNYRRLLIGDRTDNEWPALASMQESALKCLSRIRGAEDPSTESWLKKSVIQHMLKTIFAAQHYQALQMRAWGGRRVAITRKGYLCLVPRKASEKDLIYLIQGAQTPFVFRRNEEATMSYRLVGDYCSWNHGRKCI